MRYLTLIVLVASALIQCSMTAPAADNPRVRVLILTGENDPSHDWRTTTAALKGLLERTGRFDLHAAEEVRGIGPRTLAGYDVLVLNYNGSRWGTDTETAVEEFVRGGKGMVALHSVNYGQFFGMEFRRTRWVASGDPGWVAYPDMLGCSWKVENIGHGIRGLFTSRWIDRDHPISRGLEETFLADDELYHKVDLKPNAHVLATGWSDAKTGGTGKDEPVIWTVPFGKGRVVNTIFGHDTLSMYQAGFATLFCRSVEWAATGTVTLPAKISPGLAIRPDAVRVLVVTGGHDYPPAFYTLFEGYDDIRWSHATSQADAFRPNLAERFDVIVLHDMYEAIGEKERANLQAFAEAGRGIVSIHHSIIDYTSWPWFYEELIGGKFFTQAAGNHPKSEYKDDVEMMVRRAQSGSGHPVLRGMTPLAVKDEAYRNMWLSPNVRVLMETDSPDNDRPVVYVGPHPKARAVYIQLGHNEETIRQPGYRRLVHNAMLWGAGRMD